MGKQRVGLIIPAVNEEEALPSVLGELPRSDLTYVVVVDNGSTDRTVEVAREAGAIVIHEPRRGYGSACLAGIAWLTGRSPDGAPVPLGEGDVLVFLDGDHSDYPEELPLVLAPVVSGRADMCIGSRVLGGADMRALLPQAWFGNRLACGAMRLFFGVRHTDLGPFRAIRVDALERLRMSDTTFGWTVEMQLKAATLGLRVEEVPVRYRRRIGKSKITGTLAGTLRAGTKILGWILVWRCRTLIGREWTHRKPPPRFP